MLACELFLLIDEQILLDDERNKLADELFLLGDEQNKLAYEQKSLDQRRESAAHVRIFL